MAKVQGLAPEVQIPSPSAEIDPADNDLPIPRSHQRVDFADDPLGIQRAALAANIRDHAKRAAIVAAVLNLEIGARAFVSGIEHGSSQQFSVGEDVGDEDRASGFGLLASGRTVQLGDGNECGPRRFCLLSGKIPLHPEARTANNLRKLMFMRIADDHVDAGQSRDFFGRSLRVTSRDDNSRFRILASNPPDGRSGVLIGTRGDGAGIQDDDSCIFGVGGASKPTLLELAFEGCAIRLGGATAKVFYKKSGHTLMVSHAWIPGATPRLWPVFFGTENIPDRKRGVLVSGGRAPSFACRSPSKLLASLP